MNTLILGYILVFSATVCSSTNPVISSWKQSTGTTKTYNSVAYVTDITFVYYTSTKAYVLGQGIPSYSIGPWNANPNTPSGQNWVYQFPLTPTANTGSLVYQLLSLGQIGAWSNGLAIYGPWDGYSYGSLGIWHRNALYYEGISFDQCYGHPDGSGVYHNHVIPTCLYNLNNSAAHSPIVGYAFDGYPIYGPYGYSNASNAASAIKLIAPGYALRNINNRTTLSNGTVLGSSLWGPIVNITYPLGAFIEDYAWSSGNGDLDSCNGRWTVTPEYPSGTYAYFTTANSAMYPQFPFVLACFYGTTLNPNGRSVTVPTTGITNYFSYNSSSTATTISGASTATVVSTVAGGSTGAGGSTMAGGSTVTVSSNVTTKASNSTSSFASPLRINVNFTFCILIISLVLFF